MNTLYNVEGLNRDQTSAPVGAWEVNLKIMKDRPTDRRTCGLIGKFYFQEYCFFFISVCYGTNTFLWNTRRVCELKQEIF